MNLRDIKKALDIVEIIRGYGVELKKAGAEWVGKCCFHKDKTPSLHVNPAKGVFHCKGCDAKGDVFHFVMRKEGIPLKAAKVKMMERVPGVTTGAALPVASAPTRLATKKKEAVIEPAAIEVPEGTRAKLLARVAAFYARALHDDDGAGIDYLKSRRLADPAMVEQFQVGYCAGKLLRALPDEGELIEQLIAIGVLHRTSAGKLVEHFIGRVVVPIVDDQGAIVGLYGRSVDPAGEPGHRHRYLRGTHAGVFNGNAVKTSPTILATESIFDAMSLWAAGFHNVIALYGTHGWTPHHETLLRDGGVKEVVLCFDQDPAGRAATEKKRSDLAAQVTVHALAWPEGIKDANEFFLSRTPADFAALVASIPHDFAALLASITHTVAAPAAEAAPTPVAKDEARLEGTPEGFALTFGGARRYEVFAIEPDGPGHLKATIKTTHGEPGCAGQASRLGEASRFYIDSLDLYSGSRRKNFIAEAARLHREPLETIEADVNRIIGKAQEYAARKAEGSAPKAAAIPEADRHEALRLGRNADLIGELLRDFEKLGVIGEINNSLMVYLGMTSRKMDDPLAIQILSGSGAGKSYLLDTILELCPEEDLIKVTTLTDRALFYKGPDALKHKVLAVSEVAGAEGARYALRNLISDKKLTSESTIKSPVTGRHETQFSITYGPTAAFETTTNPSTDPETRSRYYVLSVDESRQQTLRIIEAQRNAHTLEGMRLRQRRGVILAKHHAFQRLLRQVCIINPYEPMLTYGDDRLMFRRDNPKYLRLILSITFLHQMQRPVKHDSVIGEYIEVTLDDIAIANQLAAFLFGHSMDELSAPSRDLLGQIGRLVDGLASKSQIPRGEVEFTRRDVRESTGWSDYQIKAHIKQLEELQYLIPISGRRGQLFSYRLAWNGEEGKFMPGLISLEELQQKAKVVGLPDQLVGPKINLEGSSRPQVGSGDKSASASTIDNCAAKQPNKEGKPENHIYEIGPKKLVRRYTNGVANGAAHGVGR
jgi:DNA primase catalytic core